MVYVVFLPSPRVSYMYINFIIVKKIREVKRGKRKREAVVLLGIIDVGLKVVFVVD